MKTVLAKSFYASRVGEALGSIAEYVKQARDLADDIKPVQTSEPVLTASDSTPQPRITVIRTIGKSFTDLEIHGKNLNNSKRFRLIPADNIGDPSYLITGFNALETEFTVTFKKPLPAGTYHAWVQDKFGQEASYPNALIIPEAEPPVVLPEKSSCEVAAVVPSEAVVIVHSASRHSKSPSIEPNKVYVEVTSAGARFPEGVTFSTPRGGFDCQPAIQTSDPKVRVIPIQINSAPESGTETPAGLMTQVPISVNYNGEEQHRFNFNLLLIRKKEG